MEEVAACQTEIFFKRCMCEEHCNMHLQLQQAWAFVGHWEYLRLYGALPYLCFYHACFKSASASDYHGWMEYMPTIILPILLPCDSFVASKGWLGMKSAAQVLPASETDSSGSSSEPQQPANCS